MTEACALEALQHNARKHMIWKRGAEGYLANPLECARVEPVCKHRCPFLVPSIPCLTISLISTGQQFFKCVGSLLLLSATSFVQDLTHNFSTRATTLPNVATVSVSSVRQFKALMHRHNAWTRHTLLSLSDWSLKEKQWALKLRNERKSNIISQTARGPNSQNARRRKNMQLLHWTDHALSTTGDSQSARAHTIMPPELNYIDRSLTLIFEITRKAHSSCRNKLPSRTLSRTFWINERPDLSSTS